MSGPPNPPSRGRARLIYAALIAAFVGGGALLFETAPEPVKKRIENDPAVAVQVHTVEAESIQNTAEITGLLEARRSIALVAEEGGRVLEIGAQALDRVDAGQLLWRLDPLLAEVAVERATASVARAESEVELARANLERRKQLAGNDIASRSALDEARNADATARAGLRESRAALREAQDRLAKKLYRAPFAGVLQRFDLEVGEVVSVGQPVGALLDVDTLRITVGLNDRQIVATRVDAPARIHVETADDRRVDARVVRVGSAIDAETRKFPVQVELENSDDGHGRLLPGMIARVEIDLGESPGRLLVPREAVLEQFGLRYAYVVEADSAGIRRAHKRRIEVESLPFQPAQLLVTAGLSPGDAIATTDLQQLDEGVQVTPLSRADVAERRP